MTFELHPNFSSKLFIADFPLCRVLLENEKHYPWLLLIPRRANVSRTIDLSIEDQMQLIKELDAVQRVLWDEFEPTQMNVAAIGNKTPQLHVHVIARFQTDPAWPNTVWDHPMRLKYTDEEKLEIVNKLVQQFKKQKI
jgi:diadenosine tetraphosphate (Ap4A) HIT family hydrolase